ncbi:MAG: hypothetical protein J6R47_02995 [Acholeplasmatales bacterium]|nr:hypothetical protein [Acholeplasmatales bacterium]
MTSKNNILKGSLSHPIVFNALFNEKRFVVDFLNSTELFNISEDGVEINNKELTGGIDFKTSNLDILIEVIDQNTKVNLEMQNSKPKYDMFVRLNYYLAKMITRDKPIGDKYSETYNVVFAIFNYTIFEDDKYIRVFEQNDSYNHTLPYSKIIVLELTKKDNCDKKKLKNWLDIFNQKDLDAIKEEYRIMSDVKKRLRELNSDYLLQVQMDEYERAYLDYNSNLVIAKEELEAARKEAKKEGHAEGLVEGRAEGLVEGRLEGRAEGHAEGHAEGRAEGLAEGRAEGRAEGLVEGRAEGHAEGIVEGENLTNKKNAKTM